MELTAFSCNMKASKHRMRAELHAKGQKLIEADVGVLWEGEA